MFYIKFLQTCLNLAVYRGNRFDNKTEPGGGKYYAFSYGRYKYDVGPIGKLLLSLVGLIVLGAPVALIIWLPTLLPVSQGVRTLISLGVFLIFYMLIIGALIKEVRHRKDGSL